MAREHKKVSQVMTEYPLTKAHRIILARAFKHVPRVDMSIDCVVEGQMGQAFVDDPREPSVFRIQVGPFFYLAGDAAGHAAREMLAGIVPHTLLMPSSPGWIEAGKAMHGERLVGFDRFSFSSEHVSAEHLDTLRQASAFREPVRRMHLPLAMRLWEQDHFVDLSAFDSPEDFVQRGIGFYVERRGTVVAAAYSSLVCSRGIEVSLFVTEEDRRQGIATVLASHLLTWCIENSAEANWDAANTASCRLAKKLGYTHMGRYRAHYLAG
jgi:GNAT superfamily N-acetyltransferase